jgi:hypothetical protein
MPESIKDENIVYVLQELPGTKAGAPKINIMSASKYGKFKFLLPEFSQIIFSPGPLIFKLRKFIKRLHSKRLSFINRRSRYYWGCLFYSI